MSDKKYQIAPVNITKVLYKLLTFIPRNTKFQSVKISQNVNEKT